MSGPPQSHIMNETPAPQPSRRVIIYACSGCSDAGELADRTARALARQHRGEMSCLAGIGGRVTSMLNRAKQAEEIVVIDGCPLNCARHTLAQAGFTRVQHLELHRLGLRKGNCPVTAENLATAVAAGVELIQALNPVTEKSI